MQTRSGHFKSSPSVFFFFFHLPLNILPIFLRIILRNFRRSFFKFSPCVYKLKLMSTNFLSSQAPNLSTPSSNPSISMSNVSSSSRSVVIERLCRLGVLVTTAYPPLQLLPPKSPPLEFTLLFLFLVLTPSHRLLVPYVL